MKNYLFILGILVIVSSCRKVEFEEVERTYGEADFSTYIAVGNSLTQGFQDGGVYEEGQENSYPAIIAGQMELVYDDMNTWRQPTIYANGSGYMHLEYIDGEIEVISAGDENGYVEDGSWANWGASEQGTKFNNLGISGITLMQCVAMDDEELAVNNGILGGVSFPPFFDFPGNPFARFMDFGENPHFLLGNGTPIQYIDHIEQSSATFFTCWLGDNDVLGYATSGGVSTEIDLSFFGLGIIELNSLSDPTEFRMKYDSVLTAFSNLGAKGVCATIPDVTVIPYFNTFTVASIKEEKFYNELWIEEGEAGSGNIRVATDADLILLTAVDSIETGMGGTEENPLTDGYVLDAVEVANVQTATLQFNSAIKLSAAMFNYPVLDMHAFLETLKPGISFEGIGISPTYISGGAFSLDGIHLNPRGYAIAANEFIKTINAAYGCNIPLVSVGAYRGVVFP